MRPIIGILLLLFSSAYPQTVNKVLISGIAGYEAHDLDVKTAFEQGYSSYNGTPFEGEITLYAQSIYNSFNYAVNNNYEIIIRSTTGLSTGIYYANNYPGVKLFMPAGSNSFVLCYGGDIETCPVIVSGAGGEANGTGYKIDFYSIDPITESNYSSFSNGYIAGQIAYLANVLDCTIDEARNHAREYGTENGTWDYYDGYGSIDVGGTLDGVLPVELISFSAQVHQNTVRLAWQTETEINNYGFEVHRAKDLDDNSELQWEKIAFINGHGTSNKTQIYNYSDADQKVTSIYYYRLKQIDNDGQFEYSKIIEVDLPALIEYSLSQNYPNPFNPTTTIKFNIPEESKVKLIIFDILGNEIKTIFNGVKAPGIYRSVFDLDGYAAGIYYYKFESENFNKTNKMILLK